jgi:hypothetical protein
MENKGEKIPKINLKKKGKYYKKTRAINTVGKDGITKTVAIPIDVLNRKAEEKGMTQDEFVETHQAVIIYNSFDGFYVTFKEKVKTNSPQRK